MPLPPPRPVTGPTAPGRIRSWRALLSLACVAACCLVLGGGDTLADPLPASSAGTAAESRSSIEERLLVLHRHFSDALEERLLAQTDRITDKASQQQLALLLADRRSGDAMERRIERRRDRELALGEPGPNRRAPIEERQVLASRPPLRMETGSLEVDRRALQRAGERRIERRQPFLERFAEVPHVTLGLRLDPESEAPLPRVSMRVIAVDEAGFDYELRAWGEAAESDVVADWVAFANRHGESEASEGAAPASRR